MDVEVKITLKELFSVPDKKLRYVLLKKDNRKILHQFLDVNYPKLKKRSVFCKKFEVECYKVYKKCYYCHKPVLLKYHHGYTSNNQDEYYQGQCTRCRGVDYDADGNGYESHISWEPNYGDDDEVFKAPIHMKMLVFGNYNYEERKYGKTENKDDKTYVEKDITEILKDKKIYEIDLPKDSSLTNTQLAWYIFWSLNFEQQGKNDSPKSQLLNDIII